MPKGNYPKTKESIVPLRGIVRDGKLAALLDQDGVELGMPVTASTSLTGGIEISGGGSNLLSIPGGANNGIEWTYLAGDLPNWTKGAEWTNGYPISTGEIQLNRGLHMRFDGSQLTTDSGLLSRTGISPALSFTGGRRIGILVYAHRLNPTTGIRLRVGTSASNYMYYNWATVENTLVEGWNWLVIHSQDTGQIRKIQTGVTMAGWQVGAGTYNFDTTPATYLAVEVTNMRAPNYPILWVSSIFADGGEAVPAITLGFDITTGYESAEAILDKYGLCGYLSVGRGTYAQMTDFVRLYKKGWDIVGHTGRHQNIGAYIERSEMQSEMNVARVQSRTLGLQRSADLFVSPNGNWSNKLVYMMSKCGFKWHRAVNNAPVTQYDTSVGRINPLIQGGFSCGGLTLTELIAKASTLLETYKANCHFYTHEVVPGGDGTNWPADTSKIYEYTLDGFCAWLRSRQDSGACQVITPSKYLTLAGGENRTAFDEYPVLNSLDLVLSASPSVISNTTNTPVVYAISGGTVSGIEFSFDGTNYIPTGQVSGMIIVEPGCSIRITHTVPPTVKQLRFPM